MGKPCLWQGELDLARELFAAARHQPGLIAELDKHLRSLDFTGQERSIQDVVNEVLDLWLEANARQK